MGAVKADRGVGSAPVRRLTVLYDAECSLCTVVRKWLARQAQLVPLDLVPAGSDEARRRFPGLDHGTTLDDITVIGDGGQVYLGPAAWVVTLWALREYRPMAHRMATPAGARLARGAVLAAAKYRSAARSPQGWVDGSFHRGDGWSYHPQRGWTLDRAVAEAAAADACDSGRCASR
ncbi:thiol-disulfide oxidoreductase DCC family protein [Streptomyces sp. NBC_01304]|uniref:thiol-disulfide oxidoreductase DCC family protein n=1 Tax=Streptomyces sp. NBC_01304 TaxID=2903818 RepID=UPI002E0F5EEB|nr:DUF393 domain-containing protein [Streptomyces sp. NBC_01304]